MIEVAVGYVGAFLARKSLGLLARAGSDVEAALDDKLSELYDWVKEKLTGRPSGEASLAVLEAAPEGKEQQVLLTDQLNQAVSDDEAALQQLQTLVAELDELRPPGVTVEGLARAGTLRGRQTGLRVEGTPPAGSVLKGEAVAEDVEEGGSNVGTEWKPG